MSDNQHMIEFTLQAVLYRDGMPLDPLMFHGLSADRVCVARVSVNPQVFEESAIDPMPLFIEQLCDGIKRELLRVYCGITEGE